MPNSDQRLPVRSLVEGTGLPFTAAHFPPRATIFHQGDEGDSVIYIESGRVELAAVAPNGKEAICGILDSGSFLGEEGLAGSVARPHTAITMTPTDVLIIERPVMVQLLETQREFVERFVEHSVGRTARLTADLVDQLLYSCEARLARALIALANPDAGDPMRYTLPNVTQEFIARMVGTTRSRVNHFLGKFKRLGFVEERNGVLQLNPAMLFAISGGVGMLPAMAMRGSFGAEGYQ